jgi:GH25 family lysozyme M1 (1,4-beta-N-acetylmuramidase)
MKKGLTTPNVQYRAYTDAEIAGIVDLAPDVLVWIIYGSAIDLTHQAQLKPYLDAHHPRILYRPYADNIAFRDPRDWALICAHWITPLAYLGELIPANELNLEGMGEDWNAQILWLQSFVGAWGAFDMQMVLHLPALSPTGKWADGLWAYKKAGLDLLFERIDVHAYGTDAETIVTAVHAILPGLIDVTEFNQIDPLVFAGQHPPAESATWFLIGGEADQAQYDLLKQPSSYASFKAWRTNVTTAFTPGIDVSNHQGTIDWPLVARCTDIAIIKASEGPDPTGAYFTDKFFAANWKGAKDNGLARAAYHFGRPSHGSGHDEANYFLSVVTSITQGDVLVLDLEDDRVSSTADLAAYVIDFMQTVEAKVGFKPMLYSSKSYLDAHKCSNNPTIAQHGLWIAAWQTTLPTLPAGWSFFAIWQYYDKAKLPGISTLVDVNYFNGDLTSFKRYGKP